MRKNLLRKREEKPTDKESGKKKTADNEKESETEKTTTY